MPQQKQSRRRRPRRWDRPRSRFFEELEQRLPLATRPVLNFSTYLGGVTNDNLADIAVDKAGNTYVIGTTASASVAGEVLADKNHQPQAFLARFDPIGELEFATLLGPSAKFDDSGYASSIGESVVIGPDEQPYVVYQTYEAPTIQLSAGGLMPLGGAHQLHVVKFNAEGEPTFDTVIAIDNGPTLTASLGHYPPFFIATGGFAVDTAGNAYLGFQTWRPKIASTPGPGFTDIDNWITCIKVNGQITNLQRLPVLPSAIAVDAVQNIYFAATTNVHDLFVSEDAFQPQKIDSPQRLGESDYDVYVAELAPNAEGFLAATYLGGDYADIVGGIAVKPDQPGVVYLAGGTGSSNFPLENPLQARLNLSTNNAFNHHFDGFVTILNLDTMQLHASTYLGGSVQSNGGGDDTFSDIALDVHGAVYVVGESNSSDFPLAGPLQQYSRSKNNLPFNDLIVAKLDNGLSSLSFSTYFGSSGHDSDWFSTGPLFMGSGTARIAVDRQGSIHVAGVSKGEYEGLTGRTSSDDFPLKNPAQPDFAGGSRSLLNAFTGATDGVVFSFDQRGILRGRGARVQLEREFTRVVAQFTDPRPDASPSEFEVQIHWGDGSTSSGRVRRNNTFRDEFTVEGTHQYGIPGSYPILIDVKDGAKPLFSPTTGINISSDANYQIASAMTVDPLDPQRLFAVMDDELGLSKSGDAKGGLVVATSVDGGATWSPRWAAREGDTNLPPALGEADALFDNLGNLFLTYRALEPGKIIFAWSTNGGATFSKGNVRELFAGDAANPPGRPKLATSPLGEVWITFHDPLSDRIMVGDAEVTGTGEVGELTLRSVDGSDHATLSDIAIGPNSELVVIWQTLPAGNQPAKIMASRDADGRGTFKNFEGPIVVDSSNTSGELTTPAQLSAVPLGATLAWAQAGAHKGRLYAAYTDLVDSASGRLGILVSFSDDGGATWGDPRTVTLGDQFSGMFLPSIAADPISGDVAIGWYGTLAQTGTQVDYYVAVTQEGKTFSDPMRVSRESSDALNSQNGEVALEHGFGQAARIGFLNGTLYPFWSDNSSLRGENPSAPQFEGVTSIVGVIQVRNGDPAIRPLPFDAIKDQPVQQQLVGTFHHPDSSRTVQNFTATIHWGDGSTSAGTIGQDIDTKDFLIFGDHTYTSADAHQLWLEVRDRVTNEVFTPVSNVTEQSGSQVAATITIDPSDSERVFAAGVETTRPNFAGRGLPIARSEDGGVTWHSSVIANGDDEFPEACCDPRAVFDDYGNLFLTYVSRADHGTQLVVLRSADGGDTFFKIFSSTIGDVLQPAIAVGPSNRPNEQSLWITWAQDGDIKVIGADVSGLSIVSQFTQTTVVAQSRTGYQSGDVAVGLSGEVLISYTADPAESTNQIRVQLDPDGLGPKPFSSAVQAAVTKLPLGTHIPVFDLGEGIRNRAWLAWDRSDGPFRGRVYMVYADAVELPDTDVFLQYSDDQGRTWSDRIGIADTENDSQFAPSVAVDQVYGNVAVTWRVAFGDGAATLVNTTLFDTHRLFFQDPQIVSLGFSDATHVSVDPLAQLESFGHFSGISFVDGFLQSSWSENSEGLESNADPRQFEIANARIAVVQVSRAPLLVDALNIDEVEGNEFDQKVATFRDSINSLGADAYRAKINWGGSSGTSAGTIVKQADGSFEVFGSHEYKSPGTFLITVTVTGPETKGTASALAAIRNGLIEIDIPDDLRVVREHEFTEVIATFTDENPHSNAAQFDATIEWGDGAFTDGAISLQQAGGPGVPGIFTISGKHNYLSENNFAIHVSVRDKIAQQRFDASGSLISGDPELEVKPGDFLDIEALEGIDTGDLLLVKFTVPDDVDVPLQSGLGEYTATINWGDGEVTTDVTPFVTSEDVTVVGRHTYLTDGEYFPTVTLADDSGGVFRVQLIAVVEPDVTSQVRAIGSGLVYNPVTDRFIGELNIVNSSTSEISGPLFVVIHDLPAEVELVSFKDVDGAGNPIWKVNQSRLSPGANLPSIPLEFRNPNRVSITYSVQVFDGLRPDPLRGGLVFEPNRGQAGGDVSFVAVGSTYAIGLAADHATLLLRGDATSAGTAAFMQWIGGSDSPTPIPLSPLPGVSNYFLGSQEIIGVPHYARVRYESVYDGIDLEYYGREGVLEYDWIVQPGARPSDISMQFAGVDGITIDAAGNLRLAIGNGELVQRTPVAYQLADGERQIVSAEFVLNADSTVTIAVGDYDPTAVLVIDPVLVYATYFGSSTADLDVANRVAVDDQGNTYITGRTFSDKFPTVNPLDSALNDPTVPALFIDHDAFLTKFDPQGVPVFSTYLGGSVGAERFGTEGFGVAVDDDGRIWVAGQTNSPSFPTTTEPPFALDALPFPEFGAFLTQFAPDGSAIEYSTFFAGGNAIYDIAVNGDGAVYAVGNSGRAVFAFKLDLLNASSSWRKYYGPGAGIPKAIAVDSLGQIFIGGFTNSPDFITKNALFPELGTPETEFPEDRFSNGFVMKLSNAGQVLFSTFLGRKRGEAVYALDVDDQGIIHVGGVTHSPDFPVKNGIDTALDGDQDGFLVRLSNDGSTLLYGTFVGGSKDDAVNGLAVDAQGRTYLSGVTYSTDLPTRNSHQPAFEPSDSNLPDGFAASLSSDGTAFNYLTYWGGSEYDELIDVAVDDLGNASFVGRTTSADLPTYNAWQRQLAGGIEVGTDAFVVRLLPPDAGTIALHNSPFTAVEGTPFDGLVAFFESNGTETADQFSAMIDWGDGQQSAGTIAGDIYNGFQVHGRHLYTDVGTHDAVVTLRDSLGRLVTVNSTGSVAGQRDARARYRVVLDTATHTGVDGQLRLQFNPGATADSPDVAARVSGIQIVGGTSGASTSLGGVTVESGGALILTPTTALNQLVIAVRLGERIEFDVTFSGPGISEPLLNAFADVFAVQLLNADGTGPLLGSDESASVVRIIVAPGGGTTARVAGSATVAATGRATVANAPISLTLSPFNVQEGLDFELPVATFTSSNRFESASDFTARVDFGDGAAPTLGRITGDNGTFTVYGSHAYQRLGSYSLSVTVIEPDGQEVTVTSGREIGAAVRFDSFGNSAIFAAPVTGDFNGDGILDAVMFGNSYVPDFAGPGIGVLLGRGDGSFVQSDFKNLGKNLAQLAVADFNKDGKLDLAAAISAFSATVVELWLGNGDGTLQDSVQLADLTNAGNLIADDFNRDGKIDLAYTKSASPTSNNRSHELQVALGHGDGTFQTPRTTEIPFAFHSVYSADVDADQSPDIILASGGFGTTTLYFLKGLSDGTFGSASAFSFTTGFARSLAIGDFNRDGRRDIAHIDGTNLNIIQSSGAGSFDLVQQLATASSAVVIGDFDGDDRPDLATNEPAASSGLGRLLVFINGAHDQFNAGVAYEGIAAATTMFAADFDGDSHVDLAASGHSSAISVLVGIGDGTFASAERHSTGLFEPQNRLSPRGSITADMNDDGRLDAVLVMSDGRIATQLRQGNGQFQSVVSDSAGPTSWLSQQLVDMNNDQKLDLVTVNQGTEATCGVSVLLGNGDGSFQSRIFTHIPPTSGGASTSAPEDVAAADLNGDGFMDLAVSMSGGTKILFGSGNGSFSSSTLLTPAFGTGLAISSNRVGLIDMDGDGDSDLVTLHHNVNQAMGAVAVWRNDGSGVFAAPMVRNVPMPDYLRGVDMALADLNGDARPDVVVSDVGNPFSFATSGGVSVMLGVGDGSLTVPQRSLLGPRERPYRLAIGDLNQDQRPDITALIALNGDFNGDMHTGVAVFMNNGDGSFGPSHSYDHGGGEAGYLATGDFNGDGAADIIVPHRGSTGSTFSVLYSGTRRVMVFDAPVTVTGTNLNPRAGLAFTTTVATFVDGNQFAEADDFIATIDWGDGRTSTGAIHAEPLEGFAIVGSHTYSSTGTFTTTIRLKEIGEAEHVGSATARVSSTDQSINASSVQISAMEDLPFTGIVASFTDSNIHGSTSDFTALIRWGDGNTSSGRVQLRAGGGFEVIGTHTYTNPGALTLGVEIQDIAGGTASTTANIVIAVHANHRPIASDDTYGTPEDVQLVIAQSEGVLANDADPDDDLLSAVVVNSPAHGELALAADGSFTYRPAKNFSGTDSFTYKARDGAAEGNIATVSIVITPVNDAPDTSDDSAVVSEDSTAVLQLLSNDTDSDSAIDPTSIVFSAQPLHGSVFADPQTGAVTYKPLTNFTGTDRLRYQVRDASGALSAEAVVSITVTARNDAPIAFNDRYKTGEDTPLIISASAGVLTNDVDGDGDQLSAIVVDAPAHGTLILNSNGSFSYTPDRDFTGREIFRYRATDASSQSAAATVVLFVMPVNDVPALAPLASVTIDEGERVMGAGSFADPDADDSWSATVDYGDSSALENLALEGNRFAIDHLFPESGVYSVKVTVVDQQGAIGTSIFPVTVRNLAPTLPEVADKVAPEGSAVSIQYPFSDSGILDTHTATINWGDGTSSETIQVSSAPGVIQANHVFRDEGPYLAIVTISDDEGASSSNTVKINVTNVAPHIEAGPDLSIKAGTRVDLPALSESDVSSGNLGPQSISVVAGSFVDPGAVDLHTATIDWGDGTVETASVEQHTLANDSGISGGIKASHVYPQTGTFTARITVTDNDGAQNFDTFVVTVTPNTHPYRNPRHRLDVNDDTFITPFDAALVLSFLKRNGVRAPSGTTPPYYDTAPTDDLITPHDALAVLSFLASEGIGREPQAEGEYDNLADQRALALTMVLDELAESRG